jgi:potassium channel subfamily K
MTYFQALYFCYISLLTIGYGDLSPKSNAGRCFFVVWSLIAVPTMTILVSDMGDTVVDKFKRWSNDLADFTVLPKYGIWRAFLEKHPWLLNWVQRKQEERQAKSRLRRGFETADPDEEEGSAVGHDIDDDSVDPTMTGIARTTTLSSLAAEAEGDASGRAPTAPSLSRGLAASIKRVACDLQCAKPKKYDYEEWVEFTRLIRWSSKGVHEDSVLQEEDDEGLVEWDWIGADSPLLSGMGESQWLLNKLCEALVRVERRKEAKCRGDSIRARPESIRTRPRDDRLHDLEEEDHDGRGNLLGDENQSPGGASGKAGSRDTESRDGEDAQNQELVSGANAGPEDGPRAS